MLRQGAEGQLLEQSVLSPHRGLSVGSWLLGEQDQASSTTSLTSAYTREKGMASHAEKCGNTCPLLQSAPRALHKFGLVPLLTVSKGEITYFHQRRKEVCSVLAPCQEFFYLWYGRSTNRKGKICRVKSLGFFLFSFQLAFTNISGITPSSRSISGKENQCLKSSYTLICACFHKWLVLDNPVGVIYALPNYAVNRLVHFLFCFFLNKA